MTPSTTPLLLPPLFGPKKVISPPQTHILLDFRSCGSKESPDFFVFVRQEKNNHRVASHKKIQAYKNTLNYMERKNLQDFYNPTPKFNSSLKI